MARHASTYRQARRETYRRAFADGLNLTWAEFNARAVRGGYSYGTVRTTRAQPAVGRSKYMPHIGAKQRAKGAAA